MPDLVPQGGKFRAALPHIGEIGSAAGVGDGQQCPVVGDIADPDDPDQLLVPLPEGTPIAQYGVVGGAGRDVVPAVSWAGMCCVLGSSGCGPRVFRGRKPFTKPWQSPGQVAPVSFGHVVMLRGPGGIRTAPQDSRIGSVRCPRFRNVVPGADVRIGPDPGSFRTFGKVSRTLEHAVLSFDWFAVGTFASPAISKNGGIFWAARIVVTDRPHRGVRYALRGAYFPTGSFSPILMQGASRRHPPSAR